MAKKNNANKYWIYGEDAAACPDVAVRADTRSAVSDFVAMVFLLLAAAQSSRRAGGMQ